MSIDEIAESQGIRRKDTLNLFWGLYGYSLQYPIPPEWNEIRANSVMRFWATAKYMDARELRRMRPKLESIHQEHKTRIKGLIDRLIGANPQLADGEFYYATSDAMGSTRSFVTFYLKTEADAVSMMLNTPDEFTTLTRPPSTQMLEKMKEVAGKKVVVRSRGWHADHKKSPEGGYLYKVELLSDCYDLDVSKDDIAHRVHNISFDKSYFADGKGLYLYLHTEDDLFLAKIALSQFIKQVTECIIITDK